MNRTVLLIVASLLIPVAVEAGTYFAMEFFARDASDFVPPFAIVHPPGYTGAGGELEVRVCVDMTDTANHVLVGPLQDALAIWNGLQPTTGNCGLGNNCFTWEDATAPAGTFDAMSAILHELGHCAFGLGHPDFRELVANPRQDGRGIWFSGTCDVDNDGCCGELTSFTNSINAEEVLDASGIRGDQEDDPVNRCPTSAVTDPSPAEPSRLLLHQGQCSAGGQVCPSPANCCPFPPPVNPIQVQEIAWFRRADNDPVVVDGTVIDSRTFSRSTANLPAGHRYARNANRRVAEALGHPRTQTIMYSVGVNRGMRFIGLAPDDVNMVEMGMSGRDRLAGTADDYTVRLSYQADCAGAQVRVLFGLVLPPGSTDEPPLGQCQGTIDESFNQSGKPQVFHWSIVPEPAENFINLRLNPNPGDPWDFHELVFRSDLESGDLREWSGRQP
jgi:hypothetical protein